MDDLMPDPGVPTPEATPSVADQAFPLPPLQPTEMGLPAPPQRALAPAVPIPELSDKQKLVRLAALGALFGAGPQAAPMVHTAIAGQQQIQQEQQQALQQQQAHQAALDRQLEQDQRTYQVQTEQRQKDLQGAVTSVRGQLAKAKTQAQYDSMVEGFSNLLRARGYRIDSNWVRQVQPFVAPTKQQIASDALDKLLNNPLTEMALKSDPSKVLGGTVSLDLNDDGTPETYTLLQLSVLAQRPMIQDAQGQPIVPDTKGEQIPADPFKAKVQSLTNLFVATNRRQPNPKEQDDIVNQARAFTQEKPPATSTPPSDLKPGSREYKIAQDLAFGRLTFPQFRSLYSYSRDVNAKTGIYETAQDLNPNFNPAQFELGYRFAENPKIQQQVASIRNAESSVPDLLKFSDAASRAKATILNGFIVRGGIAMGGKQYTNFAAARKAFADELSGALGFGTASDMKLEMGMDLTDPSLSPENFKSAIQTVVLPFLNRKKASLLGPMGIYGPMSPGENTPPAAAPPTTGRDYGDYLRAKGKQ